MLETRRQDVFDFMFVVLGYLGSIVDSIATVTLLYNRMRCMAVLPGSKVMADCMPESALPDSVRIR